MYLKNGRLSKRQVFRVGMLENIALGIVVIPYITTSIAGNCHVWGFLLGLLFVSLYGLILFAYSKVMPEGLIENIDRKLGWYGIFVDAIYSIRYVIKASLIVVFFGKIIKEYMLKSYNIWGILIPFILICLYGAARDIEKRGRLLEFLFWWMIVPLIVVAAFSISNVSWQSLPKTFARGMESTALGGFEVIFTAAYAVLVVLSTIELMQFNLCRQKRNEWQNSLKLLIWIIVSMVLAYAFIIGILGEKWVAKGSTEALSVMQASSFPGGLVERLDYPILAFWIIGIFASVSGYMFYAKEFAKSMVRAERKASEWWVMLGILLAVTGETVLINESKVVFGWMLKYVFTLDIAVSILLPLVVFIAKRVRDKGKILGLVLLCLCVSFNTGCANKKEDKALKSESIENRDYVVQFDVGYDDYPIYVARIADISEYKGESGGKLETIPYNFSGGSVADMQKQYYEENGKQLDLGHLKMISIGDIPETLWIQLLEELFDMNEIAKSVPVKIEGQNEEIILRELIKQWLSRES